LKTDNDAAAHQLLRDMVQIADNDRVVGGFTVNRMSFDSALYNRAIKIIAKEIVAKDKHT